MAARKSPSFRSGPPKGETRWIVKPLGAEAQERDLAAVGYQLGAMSGPLAVSRSICDDPTPLM
jgi:hypothetical protein